MTHLSPREREIVVLVGRDGAGYRRVALTLGIEVPTVRTYARRIRDRLHPTHAPREALICVYWTEVHGDEAA